MSSDETFNLDYTHVPSARFPRSDHVYYIYEAAAPPSKTYHVDY